MRWETGGKIRLDGETWEDQVRRETGGKIRLDGENDGKIRLDRKLVGRSG